jgi:hypothetical protein
MTAQEQAAKDAAEKQAKANEDQLKKDQLAASDAAAAEPIVLHGRPGEAFSIDGSGFGASKGTLKIGDRMIDTTRWDDTHVRGLLPLGVRGVVELTTASGVRHGVYPSPRKVVVTTTTITVEKTPTIEQPKAK